MARRAHEVLSRARWDGQAVARRLLLYPRRATAAGRRGGGQELTTPSSVAWARVSPARGIYRDPVRSSKGHFVHETSGPYAGGCR